MQTLRVVWVRVLTLILIVAWLPAWPIAADDADLEEAKEKSIVDRFVVVLEKSPRRGTALDKVYGFHVERGSLPALIGTYQEKAKSAKGVAGSSPWMIVGLLESLRGQDAAAVAAFEQAEKLAGDNYLASYYLGQSLVLVGQPDKAAEALERSIERKPNQADLLEIFQALGRVYQRAQKTSKALEVWNRLEKQVPNDARVQEQIATTLLEEGEFAAALPRYELLAKVTKDRYRQSLFQMESADIKVRLGRTDEAVKEFESLLGQLLPDNWLYKEVRRRIEAIYLRTDDQAGLIAYYESWLAISPKDLNAMTRLSRLLAGYGRAAESQMWLERGLKVAPTKKELRQALISQYLADHKHAAAITQYEQLDKYEPNNPDTLREWGRQILKDRSRDEATRRADAAAVWRRWIDARPNDPLVVSQVGELFRKADMVDEALELYQRAISLAPDQGQYREYLGEYFHSLKRKDEALATWRAIADGKQRTAPNLARMAEVLASFGYLPEAVETHAEACQLDPKDFSLQLKHVDLLAKAEQHDGAFEHLKIVGKLAANEEEREAWLSRELRELQALDQLKSRIAEVAGDQTQLNAEQWFWLARAYETQRLLKEAAFAVTKAGDLAPQSVPVLKASARIHEAQNNWLAAVEVNTRLAAVDRRYRTEYLKQIATLEQRLGRRDKAIQAGRDLLAAAPGNPEVFEFFSQLCFQLGEVDEGLSALRRSVRVNPAETKGMLLLAAALTEQFKTSEAIELYWRAFDKSANLDDRLRIVPLLAELYLQTNQLDRLLERLERQRREANQQREMTICIAQAYQSIGDDGNARQELEKLLTEDTKDTQLLTQLVKLCESDGDLDAAIKFQQQVLKLTPDKDTTMRLAQLLTRSGEPEEAAALLKGATASDNSGDAGLHAIDELLTQAKYDQALPLAEKLTADDPGNWEAIYREGVALANLTDRSLDAAKRFEAILAMKLNDDEVSSTSKLAPQNPSNRSSFGSMGMGNSPIRARIAQATRIRRDVGLLQGPGVTTRTTTAPSGVRTRTALGSGGSAQMPFSAPTEFGAMRMASLGWLETIGRKNADVMKSLEERRERASQSDDMRELVDWYYLSLVAGRGDSYSALYRISMRPDSDVEFKSLYLTSLNAGRVSSVATVVNGVVVRQPIQTGSAAFRTRVRDAKELDHVLACYRALGEDAALTVRGAVCFPNIMAELANAGRQAEADKLFADALAHARHASQLEPLLVHIGYGNDLTLPMKILDRMEELRQLSPTGNGSSLFASSQPVSPSGTANLPTPLGVIDQMLRIRSHSQVKDKPFDEMLTVWDRAVPVIAAQSLPLSHPSRSNRRTRLQATTARQSSILIAAPGGVLRGERLDFPLENQVYDIASLQILRQIFVNFQDANRAPDLIGHFQKRLTDEKISGNHRPVWQLGLGYLLWWQDDKSGAIAALKDAIDAVPDNQEMKFELARMYEKIGQTDQALQLLDSLPPTDQQAMQQREITALRLAVNTGNINRARTAAERLFGLRLDPNLQIQLAQQMHQLGMHEQAEALLVRAQRQAGNKTDVLMTLMQQYQAQGKNDVAAQIAYQLLRRSGNDSALPAGMTTGTFTASSTSSAVRRIGANNDGARHAALSVLQKSGKLPEMIKKVETQLEHSPNSQRLLTTLIEYSSANGDEKRVAELTTRIMDKKRDDPLFRFNIGQQLMQQGKHKEAIEHFQAAIAKDPLFLRNQYSQLIRSYQNAGQMQEMARLLESIDLKAHPENYTAIQYFLQSAGNDEKLKDATVSLFRKVWKEIPDQRRQQVARLNNEAIWQMPEIYDYAHEIVIPSESMPLRTSIAVGSRMWPGFGQMIIKNSSSDGDVKLVTFVSRFLKIAEVNHRLDELASDIKAAQQKYPDWESGPALLGLVELRQGKVSEARQRLEAVLPSVDSASLNTNVPWEIAQDLMENPSCEELAIKYLEIACKNRQTSTNNFRFTPSAQLLSLYQKKGRRDDARRLIYAVSRPAPSAVRGNDDYEAYQRIHNCLVLANELTKLGYPADAIRIYQEQLSRTDDFLAYRRIYGVVSQGVSEADRQKAQIEKNLTAALKALQPEMIPELLGGPAFGKSGSEPQSALEPANAIGEPINLMLTVESRDLDNTVLSSALDSLVSQLSAHSEISAATKSTLAQLKARRPDDLTVHILAVQQLLTENDAEATSRGIKELVDLIDTTPLDASTGKGSLTPAQQRVAIDQSGLWLVARTCLRKESTRASGTYLAERALDAARRMSDKGYALAILRERGQIAVDTGDRATGERCWTEMLQTVLPQRGDTSSK